MHSVDLYLKRWDADEIMDAVSVLRNMNSIDLAITDAVIVDRMIKCGPTPRQLFCPEHIWEKYLSTIHASIHKFDNMRSVMSVVSSAPRYAANAQSVGEIAHSILCIDPIESPKFKYSFFNYVFASKYIKEEFLKYFRQQLSELQKQDFIKLIDGSSMCAVLRAHLSEDTMHHE